MTTQDVQALITDTDLIPPAIWSPPARSGFAAAPGADTLKVLGNEYGDDWSNIVAQKQTEATGVAMLARGNSMILGKELSGEDAHAVTACLFFAQCAANARIPNRQTQASAWYQAFTEALKGLGCVQENGSQSVPFKVDGSNFEIQQVLIDLLSAVAIPEAAPALLVQKAFETFSSLGDNNKIRFLDTTSYKGHHLNFLYSESRKSGDTVRIGLAHLAVNIETYTSGFLGLRFSSVHADGMARADGYTFDFASFRPQQTTLYGRMDSLVRGYVTSVPLAP